MSIAPLLGAFRVRSPAPLASLYGVQRGFRITNGYGLFASMTTMRPEIEVQGSADGRSWRGYRFPYKVDDPLRAPRFAGPHMPRLDWQLWFAALRGPEHRPWLRLFAQRLLEGQPEVRALLAHDPFPDEPPLHVRVVVRDYRFTDLATGGEGAWWTAGPARVAWVLSSRERR
jgi:hypothetical protein